MRYEGAGGPHQGITAEMWKATGNPLPWIVVSLCSSSDNSATTLRELSTETDTHGAYDLLDIDEVTNSWSHATALNNDLRRDHGQ